MENDGEGDQAKEEHPGTASQEPGNGEDGETNSDTINIETDDRTFLGHVVSTREWGGIKAHTWTPTERGHIADKIVKVFYVSIVLFFSFAVSALLLLSLKLEPEELLQFAEQALIPIMITTGDISIKLFGPLLAFILGYYFRKQD